MSEHNHVIKFDVKTYPCKCGLEFSQELAETLVEAALSGSLPTVQLGIDLEFEKRRVAELKAFINQLIEVSEKMFTAVIAAADSYDEGMREWDKIVNGWKEG
jgi:hypothetical protein